MVSVMLEPFGGDGGGVVRQCVETESLDEEGVRLDLSGTDGIRAGTARIEGQVSKPGGEAAGLSAQGVDLIVNIGGRRHGLMVTRLTLACQESHYAQMAPLMTSRFHATTLELTLAAIHGPYLSSHVVWLLSRTMRTAMMVGARILSHHARSG